MIATIEGNLAESNPLSVIIEAGGIGYELSIPITTAEKLPRLGKTVKLYTHAVYREDNQSLYGFAARDERDFFKLLVEKVSGIGPKIALNIMSRMSSQSLKQAIANGDVALLSKCPGIGKKTAERLIVELRDKVFQGATQGFQADASLSGNAQTAASDAISALVTLGYKATDADRVIRKAVATLGDEASTQELIKQGLGT